MTVSELQNDIIEKLLTIKDKTTLKLFKEMVHAHTSGSLYQVSESERSFISESIEDYKKGSVLTSDSVFKRTGEWLKE